MRISCTPTLYYVATAFIAYSRTSMLTAAATNVKAQPWIVPAPVTPHVTLSEVKARTVIVGDIHGCLDEFKSLLIKCNYNPKDTTLILVGDLVNKGPYSAEVVKYARSLNPYCVRGNHDDAALSHALGISKRPRDETYDYVDKFDSEDIDWLSALPYTISIPPLGAIVVHAGLLPNRPMDDQAAIDMVTMRNIVERSETELVAISREDAGVPWASLWGRPCSSSSGGVGVGAGNGVSNGNTAALTATIKSPSVPHVIFGHDAKRGLQLYDSATGLDTGCVYGECYI